MRKTTAFLAGALAAATAVIAAVAIPAVANAADEVLVTDKNLQGFDFAETRATGHIEWRNNGLRLYTESNTSTDKVAAFKATDVPLVDIAKRANDPSLRFTLREGTVEPGFQMRVKLLDNREFILVGEPVYAGKWWAASCGQFCAALNMPASTGGGSPYQGTLDEWVTANPGTKVTAFGFSLGSGVKADGVLRSLEFNGTTYRFAAAQPEQTTTAPPASTTTPAPPATNPSGGAPAPADTGSGFSQVEPVDVPQGGVDTGYQPVGA